MDKKNTLLGVLFIAAGMGFMFWQAKQLEEHQRQQLSEERTLQPEAPASPTPADAAIEPAVPPAAEPGASDAMLDLLAREVEAPAPEAAAPSVTEAELVKLANEFIEVTFTTRGGAIEEVRFLQTGEEDGPDEYVFNRDGFLPALSLSLDSGDGAMQEFNLNYEIARQSADSITFLLEAGDGLLIERTYRIAAAGSDQDPYVIGHSTNFGNRGERPKALASIYLNLGTARPLARSSQINYLNVGYYEAEDADFVAINKLTGSGGFLGIGASAPRDQIVREGRIEWTSVKNQFFASVLSSERTASEIVIYPVEAPLDGDGQPERPGITGSAAYAVGTVGPGQQAALDFDFYVGPKEFKRLQALGNQQDLVMQFGFFGFFSKLLLAFMYAIHAFVPSWGWAIVIMTVCIKLLFWPLTAKASQSQKRMSKIQGPMAVLKEKYKDNPQKMQQETLKLFKEHKVNPLAGCLPILIQMPVFIGLFYMLRTASELRFEPFLWVADLSQPDTIFEIGGFPVNLLPLIMGGTMFMQMQMMPTSPTADPLQQKIFKLMPLIFLVFLYNFSSGLCLYWTVQNILTIVQQKITNSRPDPEPAPQPAATKAPGKAPGKAKAKRGKAPKK